MPDNSDPFGPWTGTAMADADAADLLRTAGWGVLALADGDRPYSIPVSFGYDGEAVYFLLVRRSPDDRKFAFIGDGQPARLLATRVNARFDWGSVAVTGTVRAVDRDGEGWGTLIAALGGSDWFSPAFDAAEEVSGVQGWALEPDRVTGMEVRPDR
ncbi:pyridoxamine 5'-phosphate oxidase family protein [Salinirussus salinus]|uniref:pyridoxamine 5'-phosphate oxidase family protein n=1 Tax=Salinirussus salinus TaxID=1198300 RepID=UPI0013585AD8|nr:pyridoxamine 5'-phosphate oxidase family protein [Salinirussus salinus]